MHASDETPVPAVCLLFDQNLNKGGLLSLPSLLGVNGAGRACSVTEDDKSDEDGDDATDDIDIVELPTCNTEGC